MKKFYLVDGLGYIHRAYHALPKLTTSQGLEIGALYGFTRMLIKLIKQNPDYFVVCFDTSKPTFRHLIFPEYKAKRKETDPELKLQIPLTRDLVRTWSIPFVEREGYEADDLIATLTNQILSYPDIIPIIISGDKDMLQLVDDRVTVLNELKNVQFTPELVVQKYGVLPDQIVDLFTLCGDKTDNVPGIPGVGDKTAVKLLQKYKSIDKLVEYINNTTPENKSEVPEKILTFVREHRDLLELSRKLITIDKNVPLDNFELDRFKLPPAGLTKVKDLFRQWEFYTLLKDTYLQRPEPVKTTSPVRYTMISHPAEFADFVQMLETKIKDTSINPELIYLDLVVHTKNPGNVPKVLGLACTLSEGEIYIIKGDIFTVNLPFSELGRQTNPGNSTVYQPSLTGFTLSEEAGVHSLDDKERQNCITRFYRVLNSPSLPRGSHNWHKNYINLYYSGILPLTDKDNFNRVEFDVMLAGYLLNPGKSEYTVEDLAAEYLGLNVPTNNEISSKEETEFKPDVLAYRVDVIRNLHHKFTNILPEKKVDKLYQEIELPLIPVLSRMEITGIKIDWDYLTQLKTEFNLELDKLAREIYDTAGGNEFNINSAKQLGMVLFEKLQLPHRGKTKSGNYSTDEDTLRTLVSIHPLPEKVLAYREIQKLQSTYVESLLRLADSKHRVHTYFDQTGTVTGRLSSLNPNLQNIPIRTEMGKKIRRAFVPDKGNVLISADYSQIDLRVLAHLSEDKVLVSAFNQGGDIHKYTAQELFKVLPENVTPEMRRVAKTINFGIIYGMSAYGLAQQLSISPEVAADYITSYFDRYQGVKRWIDETIRQAQQTGYVTTLLGRIRYLPEINSSRAGLRSFAERTAVNTPVQGTAADIIKMAMLVIDRNPELKETKMLLQVHDELVFEVPEPNYQIVADRVKNIMETVVTLKVPLVTDLKVGYNWNDMHLVL